MPQKQKASTDCCPTDVETIYFPVLTYGLDYHHVPFKWSFREKKKKKYCKGSTSAKCCCQNFIHTKCLSMPLLSCGNCDGSLSNTKLILKLLGWLLRPSSWELCIYLSWCQCTRRGFIPVGVRHVDAMFQAQEQSKSQVAHFSLHICWSEEHRQLHMWNM